MLLSVRDLKAIKIPLQKAGIIFISVVSISAHLFSAFEHYPSNPVAVGSGLLFINVQANAIGIFADPASVTSFQVRSIGIVSGRRFGLKRLQHHSAVLAQLAIRGSWIAAQIDDFNGRVYFWDLNLPGEMRSVAISQNKQILGFRVQMKPNNNYRLYMRWRSSWNSIRFSGTAMQSYALAIQINF
jgi:hypothetical protein